MEPNTDLSFQAEAVLGAGRVALIESFAGAFWISWALIQAEGFVGFVGPLFGCVALLLFVGSILTIRKGRQLRKQYPPVAPPTRREMWRSFAIVVSIEIVAVILALSVSSRLHRPDLFADWFALIVGLHFLPLVKTFRAPILGLFGALIALWSVLCLVLFRGNSLLVWVAAGTGMLLWLMSIKALVGGSRIARSLAHVRVTKQSSPSFDPP